METGTKVKLGVILVLIVIGAGMVYGVSQSNFSVKSIDDIRAEGSIFVIELTLDAENPTIFPVYVTSGLYNLYIEDEFIGEGSFGEVWLWNGNSTIACTQNIESIPTVAAVKFAAAMLGLGTVKITIEITELAFFFIKQEVSISASFNYSN